MASTGRRVASGFVAGAISVLTIHQGVWALLHYLDLPALGMPPPYPIDPIPPFGVPRIVSLCFWGGVWGALFGGLWRGARGSYWRGGAGLGAAAVLTGFFIVAPLKGLPVAGGGLWNNWFRSVAINVSWGIGAGVVLAALLGESIPRRPFEGE